MVETTELLILSTMDWVKFAFYIHSLYYWCINEEIIDKDARDSEEMKKYLSMEPEDKLLGAFVFGEVDASKQFKSTRRPIEVEFRTD